jgi:hypothetical protein
LSTKANIPWLSLYLASQISPQDVGAYLGVRHKADVLRNSAKAIGFAGVIFVNKMRGHIGCVWQCCAVQWQPQLFGFTLDPAKLRHHRHICGNVRLPAAGSTMQTL